MQVTAYPMYRALAVQLIIMSCGMRTTSLLMSCRLLPTTSVTRKCVFLWQNFLWNIIFLNLHHIICADMQGAHALYQSVS